MRKEINRKIMVSIEDNTKTDPEETGWEGEDWIHLIQDRNQWRAFVNTVTDLRVP
jgi:hypothetical protein